MEIIRTTLYIKKARKLLTKGEILKAEDEIALSPDRWPVISGTGGVRKARSSKGDSGKSGGVRILYYFILVDEVIYLLDIYAKNEKENITAADKKLIKKIITELKGGAYA